MFNLGHYKVPQSTRGGLCLDVGCNLGDFTYKYRNHFARIIYIEAQTKLFENLVNRFKDYPSITGMNKAAWSESGLTLDLIEHHKRDHGSVAVKSENLNDEWLEDEVVNQCETVSIEEFADLNISYLKMDCETSEYEFLLGKDLSNIDHIGIEMQHQLGPEKYYELYHWILKTHDLGGGNPSYIKGMNREAYFKRKTKNE